MGNQNKVRTFGKCLDDEVVDSVIVPCVISFYSYVKNNRILVDYCHFDERAFLDLRDFLNLAGERGVSSVAVMGGYAGNNIVKFLKEIRRRNFSKLTDSTFAYYQIEKIKFNRNGLLVFGERDCDYYSFEDLNSIFR